MRLGVAAAVVGGQLVPGDIDIKDGMISGVGLASPGSGLALPGFIDVHTHGFAGVDFATTDEGGYTRVAETITSTGVTAFRPALMSLTIDRMIGAIEVHGRARTTGARVLGMHLEGPFLSKAHPGAHPPELLVDPDVKLTQRLLAAGRVEHVTLAPELPGAMDLIQILVSRGVTVSLGHTDADLETANRAYDAGAVALTHVFNGSRPLRHRDPGIIGVALTRDGVFVEIILDGVHLSDEVSTIVLRAAGDRVVAVTDAMSGAGLGDGSYTLGDTPVRVDGGAVRREDGTLASSVLTMDAAFRKTIALGVDSIGASRATSGAPAELIRRPELGTLAPGTPADVVVLDDRHEVVKTLVGGIVHYAR
jgi:N-acetylglucosamine-6-phosphate deacetylase